MYFATLIGCLNLLFGVQNESFCVYGSMCENKLPNCLNHKTQICVAKQCYLCRHGFFRSDGYTTEFLSVISSANASLSLHGDKEGGRGGCVPGVL